MRLMRLAALVTGLALAGCSGMQLQELTVQDTAAAIKIAQGLGDQAAVVCFMGFNQLATSSGTPVPMTGDAVNQITGDLATKIALLRGVEQVLTKDCGPLSSEFLLNQFHGLLGPFAGLLP